MGKNLKKRGKVIVLGTVDYKLSITTGDYTVLESGTVVVLNNQPVTFVIKDLTYTFEFRNSPQANPVFHAESSTNNKKVMKIIFTNFQNSLGLGNTEPFEVGFIEDKTLYLLFTMYSLSSGGKTINYSWLLRKK